MLPLDAFEPVRSALEQADIRYAIGGSWASTAYGEPRFTNDVDILAEFTEEKLRRLLKALPETFYVDAQEAISAIRIGRPFNVIHMPTAFKLDFFSADAFPLGTLELDRAVAIENTGLSQAAVPFVTPEDILLAKLYWFKTAGEISEVQWRDIKGLVRACANEFDQIYLQQGAFTVGVSALLEKAFNETP